MRAAPCPVVRPDPAAAGRLLPAVIAMLAVMASPVAADELRPRPQHVVVNHAPIDHTPIIGPRHAPVTIDFFLNLGTPSNLRLHSDLVELSRRHPRRVRVVYRLVESGRTLLAEAAMEAFSQGRFEPFLAHLAEFAGEHRRMPQGGAELRALSERAGVDYQRIEDARQEARYQRLLEANELYRKRRHAHRAPVLLYNGVLPGIRINRMDLDRLETSYDLAYAQARRKLDDGVPLEHLYEVSLREVDAAIQPIPITAGAVDGATPRHRGLLQDAPLVATPPGGHALGPDDAPVAVHFYCNFLSTHCALLKRALDDLRELYPTDVRLVFHHLFPPDLDPDLEHHMLLMHRAALCADEQGAFFRFYDNAYHDYLHRRQRAMAPSEQINEIIGDIELDRDLHTRCMNKPGTARRVRKMIRAGNRAGITQTPTVVIGGRMYPGSKSLLELRSLVDQELLPGLLESFAPTFDRERAAQPRAAP